MRRLLLPGGLGLILWAALVVPLPVMLELPDQPVSLDELVTVELDGADLNGDYLLSKVRLRRGTVAGLVEAAFVGGSVQPEARIIAPGEDDAAYFARQRDVFALAAQVAAAVGLRAAGLDADPERVVGSGVRVVSVLPGTPADGVLRSGDVIVGVDGSEVRDTDDLRDLVSDDARRARRLRFLRAGEDMEADVVPAEIRTAQGRVHGIGVLIETHEPKVALPARVEVDSRGIGGPSAGVMIALTVYDKAANDLDLAAGRRVAGTGSLAPDGSIGRVGAVEQKVRAAHRLGAEVFVVPRGQEQRALQALPDGSAVQVIAVDTFQDALDALARHSALVGWSLRRGQHRAGGRRGPVRRRTVNLVRAGRQQP